MKTVWKIVNLKRKPATGLVVEATWIVNFELDGTTTRKIGVTELEGSTEDPGFIPFESLTEEVVLGWVKDKLGEAAITEMENQYQNELENSIQRKANPEFLVGTPWKKI